VAIRGPEAAGEHPSVADLTRATTQPSWYTRGQQSYGVMQPHMQVRPLLNSDRRTIALTPARLWVPPACTPPTRCPIRRDRARRGPRTDEIYGTRQGC